MKKKKSKINKEDKVCLNFYCEGIRHVDLNKCHTEARFFHAGATDDRFRDSF